MGGVDDVEVLELGTHRRQRDLGERGQLAGEGLGRGVGAVGEERGAAGQVGAALRQLTSLAAAVEVERSGVA